MESCGERGGFAGAGFDSFSRIFFAAFHIMIWGDAMDFCVCCGRYVPEGTWVCKLCMEAEKVRDQREGARQYPARDEALKENDRIMIRGKGRR